MKLKITSTLWMSVSSRSKTRVYVLFLASPSKGGKNGGETFGKFVKLLGNWADWDEAIAEALSIAKGFLPVKDEPPLEGAPTRLEVPLVLVELDNAFDARVPGFPPYVGFGSAGVMFNASALNASMLYKTSLSFSFGILLFKFIQSPIIIKNFFFAFCLIRFLKIFSAF